MKWVKSIVFNLVLLFVLCEVALRIFWPNYYVMSAENAYIHHPHVHLAFRNIDELYAEAPNPVEFRTSAMSFVENSRTRHIAEADLLQTPALALGGSTTECVTVQEDYRWTDLLDMPTLNYGKSSLYSYHTYFNLVHLLEVKQMRPKYIFVMDGINNLSRYVKQGEDAFDVDDAGRTITNNVWKTFIAQHVYTASFLQRLPKMWNLIRAYRNNVARNHGQPTVGQEGFHAWLVEHDGRMQAMLQTIYGQMNEVAVRYGAQLVVLTQPHAYTDSYTPYRGEDFRVFPVIDGKRLDATQSRQLMTQFNALTIDAAKSIKAPVIDVAKCFANVDVSDLLYDAWHYTQKGSVFFSKCVNAHVVNGQIL
jgi:hypothetical protein